MLGGLSVSFFAMNVLRQWNGFFERIQVVEMEEIMKIKCDDIKKIKNSLL